MKFTPRGLKVLAALALTSALAYPYRDPLLCGLSLALASCFLLDACWLLAERLRGVGVSLSLNELRLIAGEEREVRAKLSRPLRRLRGFRCAKWFKARAKGRELELRLRPLIKGSYLLKELEAELVSPLGLLRGWVKVPIGLKVKAYPRLLPFVIEALRFLEVGGYSPGLKPAERKGLGLEYAWSREYVPGDPLNRLDWKATARLRKLMVKEFYEEVGGSPSVIYRADSLGPITGDELSALFLSSVLALATSGAGMELSIRARGGEVLRGYFESPIEALKVALAYVLRDYESAEWDVYEFVEPGEAGRLAALLRKVRAEGLAKLLEAKLKPSISRVRVGQLVVIQLPIYGVSELIREVAEVKRAGGGVRLFSPPKPWADCEDLEEAYLVYLSFRRVTSALTKLGVEVNLGKGVR